MKNIQSLVVVSGYVSCYNKIETKGAKMEKVTNNVFDWRGPSLFTKDKELRRHVLSVQSANTRKEIENSLIKKEQFTTYCKAKDPGENK